MPRPYASELNIYIPSISACNIKFVLHVKNDGMDIKLLSGSQFTSMLVDDVINHCLADLRIWKIKQCAFSLISQQRETTSS